MPFKSHSHCLFISNGHVFRYPESLFETLKKKALEAPVLLLTLNQEEGKGHKTMEGLGRCRKLS